MQKMKELIKELNDASKAYYNDQAIMSDKEWDDKFDTLKKMEEETGIIYQNSPTQIVGHITINEFKKRELLYPMLSLGKTKLVDDITKFIGDKEIMISDKLDGSSCEIVYENGVLKSATTRGNGYIGEDITHNAKTFVNIPTKLNFNERLVIRCELVCSYENFKQFADEYKNPRNFVSGSIRQLDSSICAERNIEAIVIDIVESPLEFEFKSYGFEHLQKHGFKCVDFILESTKLDDTLNDVNDEYPTDGKVITYDYIEYSKSLGSTSHHPKHSIAFKWRDETHTTTFKYIDWSVSRTGRITPVAVFEPVEIEGSTVERASCHNVSELKKLNMTDGDEIEIFLANMIIPKIHCNNTPHNADVTYIPSFCPECNTPTKIHNDNGVETLNCENQNCPAKIVGNIVHFCDVMGMKGISDKIIEKIVNSTHVNHIADIFDLSYEDLIKIDSFKERSVENILNTIHSNKECSFAQFLRSLGIKHIGKSVSALLEKEYYEDYYFSESGNKHFQCNHVLNNLIAMIQYKTIDGIGEVMKEDMVSELEKRRDEISDIFFHITLKEPVVKESTGSNIDGKSFCISGKTLKGKKELQEIIKLNGGIVENNVTKKLDFLISNETGTSKVKKAEKNEIKIITEEDFMEIIGEKND